MQYNVLLSLLALAPFALAENTVDHDDVPRVCLSVCQPTIDLSHRCDDTTDGDRAYLSCFCGAPNSQKQITDCASCVKSNWRGHHSRRDDDDDDDEDGDDVADLMKDCGWSFAAVATTGAAPPAAPQPTTGAIPPTTGAIPHTTAAPQPTTTTGATGATAATTAVVTLTRGATTSTHVPVATTPAQGGASRPAAAGLGGLVAAGLALAMI